MLRVRARRASVVKWWGDCAGVHAVFVNLFMLAVLRSALHRPRHVSARLAAWLWFTISCGLFVCMPQAWSRVGWAGGQYNCRVQWSSSAVSAGTLASVLVVHELKRRKQAGADSFSVIGCKAWSCCVCASTRAKTPSLG